MRAPLFGLLLVTLAVPASGQSGVGVEIDEIIDNRLAHEMMVGSIQMRVKLTGNGLDKAAAARVVVKEARDDRGTVLWDAEKSSPPDFMGREYNNGMVSMSLGAPARAATSVRVKGNVELFVPTRDPNSRIKVDKPLAKLDSQLVNKSLKAAKIEITPLSPAGYEARMKDRKIGEDEILEIRKEGKSRGVSEKEIEMMIGFAQALQDDDPLTEGTVALFGSKDDFDRIYALEFLDAEGKPLDFGQRSSNTIKDTTMMRMVPSQPLPKNATLQVTLLTDKSRMSFPFELNIELP